MQISELSSVYTARRIGHRALDTLSQDAPASVMGTTSRGVFVRVSSRRVIFLSFGSYIGPLTIMFGSDINRLRELRPGSPAEIRANRLVLPSVGVSIVADKDVVWRPGVPSQPVEMETIQVRLNRLAQKAFENKQELGLGFLLPYVLDWKSRPDYLSPEQEAQRNHVLSVGEALKSGCPSDMVEAISQLLGVGRGLTPSGDDFALGLLLCLNRWLPDKINLRGLERLNRGVVETAYRKTTTLSANMIECASCGEADEMLLAMIDSLFTGKPSESVCISYMLNWGASSGVDSLLGMAIALTT